jgi:hypothetical protein
MSASRGERVRVRRHSLIRPARHLIESTCGHSYGHRARARILGDSGKRCIRHTDMQRLQHRESQSSLVQQESRA